MILHQSWIYLRFHIKHILNRNPFSLFVPFIEQFLFGPGHVDTIWCSTFTFVICCWMRCCVPVMYQLCLKQRTGQVSRGLCFHNFSHLNKFYSHQTMCIKTLQWMVTWKLEKMLREIHVEIVMRAVKWGARIWRWNNMQIQVTVMLYLDNHTCIQMNALFCSCNTPWSRVCFLALMTVFMTKCPFQSSPSHSSLFRFRKFRF